MDYLKNNYLNLNNFLPISDIDFNLYTNHAYDLILKPIEFINPIDFLECKTKLTKGQVKEWYNKILTQIN